MEDKDSRRRRRRGQRRVGIQASHIERLLLLNRSVSSSLSGLVEVVASSVRELGSGVVRRDVRIPEVVRRSREVEGRVVDEVLAEFGEGRRLDSGVGGRGGGGGGDLVVLDVWLLSGSEERERRVEGRRLVLGRVLLLLLEV